MNLYEHDREAGETTQLTAYRLPVRGGRYSPGAERVAYTTNETDDLDNLDVYVADADGSNARNLDVWAVGAEATLSDWHPDGGRVLVSDNSTDKPRCGVYDLDTAEGHELDVPGGVAAVPGYGDTAFLPSSEVLLTHEPPSERSTLLLYDLGSDETSAILDPEYGDLDPDGFVSCEYDTFESHDGLDFEYNELGEEGHGSTDIDQKIRAFRLLGDFLERRVPVDCAAGASDCPPGHGIGIRELTGRVLRARASPTQPGQPSGDVSRLTPTKPAPRAGRGISSDRPYSRVCPSVFSSASGTTSSTSYAASATPVT